MPKPRRWFLQLTVAGSVFCDAPIFNGRHDLAAAELAARTNFILGSGSRAELAEVVEVVETSESRFARFLLRVKRLWDRLQLHCDKCGAVTTWVGGDRWRERGTLHSMWLCRGCSGYRSFFA